MLSKMQIHEMYVTFQELIKDLEPFIDTTGMRLAFDKNGHAFLVAPDFSESLNAKPQGNPSAREEMRRVLAKHRSVHSDPFAISHDSPSP